jgi:hypothetical protein
MLTMGKHASLFFPPSVMKLYNSVTLFQSNKPFKLIFETTQNKLECLTSLGIFTITEKNLKVVGAKYSTLS